MKILENISLKSYNTFGVEATGRHFAEVSTKEELLRLIKSLDQEKKPFLLLGGGSNLLFTKDYEGTIVKISTKGVKIIQDPGDEIIINAQAGENWDEFVEYCVQNGWGGLENLSLIPGNVGTGPVQNIGAYGVEIREVVEEVEAYDRTAQKVHLFKNAECEFGYRDSVFKKSRNRYIILSVTFRLSRKPLLHLDYKDIREELLKTHIISPGIKSIRDAVCAIRRRKLPDPAEIGNSGSFFKNPVIPADKFSLLKEKFPAVVSYPQGNSVKVAAAWLIEQCGWKGYRKGDAGVHPNQPLVLVNYHSASGREILDLAELIQADVRNKFGISLETEVNIL